MLFAGELEVRELRRRLMETEAQMTRILQAMENVDEKVASNVANIVVSNNSECSIFQ